MFSKRVAFLASVLSHLPVFFHFFGHHCAACPLGCLELWVLVGESRSGNMCLPNVFLRDLDLPVACHGRLEVFAYGLPLVGARAFGVDVASEKEVVGRMKLIRLPVGEGEARILKGRAIQAWHHRWCCLLACARAWAFVLSLFERRPALGSGWDTPSASDGLPHATTRRFIHA